MSMRTLRTTAMAAMILACGGIASADTFVSTSDGNWSNTGIWLQNGGLPSRVPASGDTVTISNNVHVDASAGVTVLTVDSGKILTIDAGIVLTFSGANPSATVNGQILLPGAASELKTQVTMTISGSGDVLGQSATARINVEPNGSDVTFTTSAKLHGQMQIIKGGAASLNNATFVSNGTVSADAAGTFLIASSLDSVSDNGSAIWNVESNASAVLEFARAATLAGTLQMLSDGSGTPHGGIFRVTASSADVVVATCRYDYGAFNFANSGRLGIDALSGTGTCGTQPAVRPTYISTTFNPCP